MQTRRRAVVKKVSSVQARLAASLFTCLRTVRQIVGAPDYERYLEHHARCHPDREPLDREEYYEQFVGWRFGSGAVRCC